MNKQDFRLFQDLDDDMIDEISAKYLDLSDDEIERMFAMIETKDKKQNINDEENSVEVSGVDRYTGRKWYRYAAVAASFVLIAGTVVGSVALLNKCKADKSNKSDIIASTENTTEVSIETSTIRLEDIDKDYMINLWQNSANSYEKLQASTKFTLSIARDDDFKDLLVIDNDIEYNSKDHYMLINDQYVEIPYDKDLPGGDSEHISKDIIFYYKNNILTADKQTNLFDIEILNETWSWQLSILDIVREKFYDTKRFCQNSGWTIIGMDTVCDRQCVIVDTINEEGGREYDYFDIENGLLLKSECESRDVEDFNVKATFEVTDVRFDADAHVTTPAEFKEMLEKDGYKPNNNKEYDLSYLDGTFNQQTENVTAAETTETAVPPTEMTTEAETSPVIEAEPPNVTEAENENTQPATQVSDNIDKDYIIKLVSNNMSGINRVYAKVKDIKTYTAELQSGHDVDMTIQYDKNKDCFCKFVKDETGKSHYETEMMVYKDKIVATYKQLNNYHVAFYGNDGAYDKIREILNGYDFSLSFLGKELANKDKWSIIGRETVRNRDCIVIEYNDNIFNNKSVLYIDIKSGIVFKRNTTYYDHNNPTVNTEQHTFEITEIKFNDDAPAIVPSDFKKIIKDGGYEPEDEESKDLSFLDE